MGTSKSLPTPSGGKWTPLKNGITANLGGDKTVSPSQIVGGTARALGGVGGSSPSGTGSQSGRSGGGGGGGMRGTSRGRRSGRGVGSAISGLGGFASAVQTKGLDQALKKLGLDELKGCPPAEVIARIADHLCEGTDALVHEVLVEALKNALLEAASMQEDGTYSDLEGTLQAYFQQVGAEGLIESFLGNYVFDRIWLAIENHSQTKAESAASLEALSSAVAQTCRDHVESLIKDYKDSGHFQSVDWFGAEGVGLADEIVSELDTRLKAL